MKIKKILITGAAGYLAGFIINRLRSKYELTLTDRVEPKPDFKDLPFVQADLMNYEEIEKICEGHDAVIHLVALVRERFDKPAWLFADVMVKGTWNIAEACATGGCKGLSTFQVSPPVVRFRGMSCPTVSVRRLRSIRADCIMPSQNIWANRLERRTTKRTG